MFHTLSNISSCKNDVTPKELNELFSKTMQNNKNQGVTGILIFKNNLFFQILEGQKETLAQLFTKIIEDSRHSHIIKIIDHAIEERAFNDYETGFEIIDNTEKIKKLKQYINWLKLAELKSIDNVIKTIENFIGERI